MQTEKVIDNIHVMYRKFPKSNKIINQLNIKAEIHDPFKVRYDPKDGKKYEGWVFTQSLFYVCFRLNQRTKV